MSEVVNVRVPVYPKIGRELKGEPDWIQLSFSSDAVASRFVWEGELRRELGDYAADALRRDAKAGAK